MPPVANNYNELSAIQVTVSRDDLPDEVEEVAFQLDVNAVSGMIAAEMDTILSSA